MPFSVRRRSPLASLGCSPATETTILAVLVGVLGSFGVILFKKLIRFMQYLFWNAEHLTPDVLFALPWWYRLIIPMAGGLLVGPIIYFLAREAKGHGVPEVIVAVATKNSIIRPVVVMVKIVASAISISSGGSVGREGPIVQIGAAIASNIGRLFRISTSQLKTLVGCGVAAGIGATFNAPIAGTLFALELIVTDFGLTSFTPIIVSGVVSTAIIRHFEGNTLEFILPSFTMVSLWELVIYVFLGLIAGAIGYLFTRFLYMCDDFFTGSKIPEWLRPAIGGLVVGAIAISFPHVMGVGYDVIGTLFENRMTLGIMFVLIFLKLFATSVTVGSGGSGGVFSPSLFIGAMLGGVFGTLVNMLFPEMTGSVGAYALVGMAAVNGACTLAPLSAIIILVELTNNYSMILPLMLTVVISTFVSRKLSPQSIYTVKLARQGIQLHMGEDLNILRAANVTDILRHDESTVHRDATMEELVTVALKKHRNVIFLLDSGNRYLGLVSMQNLKHYIRYTREDRPHAIPDDIIELTPALGEGETLDRVFGVFGESGYDRLPVVDDEGVLVGSVVISDVIGQYQKEVLNRNIAIELGGVIHSHDQTGMMHLDESTVITEIPVPEWMDGRKISEIGLRKNYGVSIFLVKETDPGNQEPRMVTPSSTYQLRKGDSILISGTERDIQKIRHG